MNHRAMNTASWLKFEMANRDHTNVGPALIDITSNVCMPTFKEHASADMHCSVMIPFKKKRAANPCNYAPIAKALAETCMDAATAESLM